MSYQQDFINANKEAVINATAGTGLFPSVALAQMISESSWGKNITATKANNYFGIKADSSWKGDKVLLGTSKDAQKQNHFRVYPSAQDSIIDHTNFLRLNPRYPKGGVFSSTTPEEQAKAIAAAGYAEGSGYADQLIKIINDYNLKSLDGAAGYKVIAQAKKHYIVTATLTGVILFTGYFLIFGNKK